MKFIVSASVIVLNEHNEILLMKGRRGWECLKVVLKKERLLGRQQSEK